MTVKRVPVPVPVPVFVLQVNIATATKVIVSTTNQNQADPAWSKVIRHLKQASEDFKKLNNDFKNPKAELLSHLLEILADTELLAPVISKYDDEQVLQMDQEMKGKVLAPKFRQRNAKLFTALQAWLWKWAREYNPHLMEENVPIKLRVELVLALLLLYKDNGPILLKSGEVIAKCNAEVSKLN